MAYMCDGVYRVKVLAEAREVAERSNGEKKRRDPSSPAKVGVKYGRERMEKKARLRP